MAKVAQFHTDTPEQREVHHDNDSCYEGKKIERANRKSDTGNKPLCKVCKTLG